MRWLLAALLLRSALSVEPDAGPFLDRANDRTQVMQALMALSRGDASAFTALPAAIFIASAGVPDGKDPDLIRRWTCAVPVALASLSAETRASAMEALDQRCRLLLSDAGNEIAKARIAAAFLPAPSAITQVQVKADQAFDHGYFRLYLSIAALIDSHDRRREEMALSLLGAGPVVDPSAALTAPGTPIPTDATIPITRTGLSVRWNVAPGWLLALDPWGDVRWQYRLDAKAEVVTGDGGSLIRDSRGLRMVRENGESSMLPPAPATARLLAVAGGAAWFATEREVYRIDLADHRLAATTLPAVPLSSPLVRGADSLWLTADELVLIHDMAVTNRVRHGLSAGQGWLLGSDGALPLIVAADGHSWHVGALADQLVQASPAERLALLVRARRSAEAIALFAAEPSLLNDPASRRQALLAHLALGKKHLLANADDVLRTLATTPQELATVLAAVGRNPALAMLCADHPDVLIPQDDQPLDSDPESWNHVLTGRAWNDHSGLTRWLTIPLEQRSAIRATKPSGCADHDIPQRQGDGSWRIGSRTVRCDAGVTGTTVECRDHDGALRWRHRWPALDALIAPGRSLALRDTWIVLVEGAARLRVLDLGNSALLADLDLHGADIAPDTVVPLGSGKVADLGPLGLNTVLHLRGSTTVDVPLPVPGRWLLPWGERVLVALSDGRFLAYPGGAEIAMPVELRRDTPPFITDVGLETERRCWHWQR